jgi:hypothetical protein
MGDTAQRPQSHASAASKASVGSTSSVSPVAAIKYAHQAEKLSFVAPEKNIDGSRTAVKAEYITPQDPIIILANGGRLPGVPLAEAEKLNELKAEIDGEPSQVIEDAPKQKTPEIRQRNDTEIQRRASTQSNATFTNQSSIPTSATLRPIIYNTGHTMSDVSHYVFLLIFSISRRHCSWFSVYEYTPNVSTYLAPYYIPRSGRQTTVLSRREEGEKDSERRGEIMEERAGKKEFKDTDGRG